MKKIFKPIWLSALLAGYIVIGALRLRGLPNEFSFSAAVGIGLMVALGSFVALGAIAVKQTLAKGTTPEIKRDH